MIGRMGVAAALALAGTAGAAATEAFLLSPQPRWADDPETQVVCAAIRTECPVLAGKGEIQTAFGYDELYDARGMLAGIRMTRSTGCKPLDEHLVLSQRHFRMVFHEEGKPDLDDIRAELAPGTNPDAVRIVKSASTQVSFGCG